MISALHSLFFFLGSIQGTLLKDFLYLLVFVLITYMLISEFKKNRKHEYKYLIIAFCALAIQSLITFLIFFFVVFRGFSLSAIRPVLPLVEHAFELIGLVLLSNAFMYPIIKNKNLLKKKISNNLKFVIIFTSIIEFFWLLTIKRSDIIFSQYAGYGLFILLKLFILAIPIYHIVFDRIKMRYKASIYLAFVLYAIAPLISLVNYIFFNGLSARLDVFIQPWPFLSALMFTRVIYLKLVDKIFLKNKLRESNLKYLHAKELNELKDEFVSVVSHELRTPLTSIKLYVSMLKDKMLGPVSKKQKEALDIVNEETNRLTNLINDILDLNKLESGKVTVCLAKFDLNELKNKFYYALANKKGVKVKISIPSNATVMCDPNKIKQVFINLMNNASKFTPKGGTIYVSVAIHQASWNMQIKDTGQGIGKEHLNKLFEKFYQVGGFHMTRTVKGTGLGLAIVKKIVDLHGGKVKVESELNKGTKFTVIFPLR